MGYEREPLVDPGSQHFLTRSWAKRFVHSADVKPGESVTDIGAGHGSITKALLDVGARVTAIERDPHLAASLIASANSNALTVIWGDALEVPFGLKKYRVVANIPFGLTSAILRRLMDDPKLVRADVLVQWQVARQWTRAANTLPTDLQAVMRYPYWTMRRGLRIKGSQFRPPVSVDTCVLTLERRSAPLLPALARTDFDAFVRRAFQAGKVGYGGRRIEPGRLPPDQWARMFLNRRFR